MLISAPDGLVANIAFGDTLSLAEIAHIAVAFWAVGAGSGTGMIDDDDARAVRARVGVGFHKFVICAWRQAEAVCEFARQPRPGAVVDDQLAALLYLHNHTCPKNTSPAAAALSVIMPVM